MHRTVQLLLALMLTLMAVAPVQAADRPNVIFIMVDDLGYYDLGSYGHPSIKTPVLDELGRDGIRLTSFYSGATVCTPSRMALLTGAYPVRLGWEIGVVGYKMGRHDGMSSKALTIAEIFKSEGYATGISGKWHIGDQPDTLPHAQGFDSSYFVPLSNNQTKQLWRKDKVINPKFDNRLLTEQFTDEAIRFIREKHDEPFFLYLPYTAPHFPVQAHPEWKGKSSFGVYGDVVEELDHRIGQILGTLAELELDEKTIVVFLSDNGPNPREKANCLPFRGEKWSALEGGTRVPCLVRWKGVIPSGQTSDALTGAIDLLPTLCEAAGIDWQSRSTGSPKIDGVSVWGTLLDKDVAHPRSELLYWHGMHKEPQAIRVGDWKLFFDRAQALDGLGTARRTPEQHEKIKDDIAALKNGGASGPMLFNLKEDPGETVDLSGEHPQRVKYMKARADALYAEILSGKILPIATPAK